MRQYNKHVRFSISISLSVSHFVCLLVWVSFDQFVCRLFLNVDSFKSLYIFLIRVSTLQVLFVSFSLYRSACLSVIFHSFSPIKNMLMGKNYSLSFPYLQKPLWLTFDLNNWIHQNFGAPRSLTPIYRKCKDIEYKPLIQTRLKFEVCTTKTIFLREVGSWL